MRICVGNAGGCSVTGNCCANPLPASAGVPVTSWVAVRGNLLPTVVQRHCTESPCWRSQNPCDGSRSASALATFRQFGQLLWAASSRSVRCSVIVGVAGWRLWHTTCPARRFRSRPLRAGMACGIASRHGQCTIQFGLSCCDWIPHGAWPYVSSAGGARLGLLGHGRAPVHGWRVQPALRHSLCTPVTTPARSTGAILASRSASVDRELSQPLVLAMVS